MKTLFKFNAVVLIVSLSINFQIQASEKTSDSILANVNGANITLGHLIATVSALPPEYTKLEDEYLLNGILDQIIKQELMAQNLDISELNIKVQLENEIRSLKAKYSIESQIRDFPSEQQILIAYDKVKESTPNTEEFNASHILVETEKRAREVIYLLETGSDFSELAKGHSTGPSGPNGGNLGWFGLGQMVPEFETAVIVLEVGKISQPVKTQFGWHVVKLNDRRLKPIPSLDELRPQIIQNLKQNRIEEILNMAVKKAKIELYDDQIDASLIRNLSLLNN